MKTPKRIFHLIGNAHLDPVWLWDWREGLNEALITCRSILNLMDEFDDLTFIRGESAIYRHIEENDPETFQRIVRYVESGRWDVVGGTVIQPDTNLPSVETFARQFARGQSYFTSRFGKPARVAWAADSFGHCAGYPEVLVNAGITGFAFTRPAAHILPLSKPAFWWEAPSGARVLAYRPSVGWYGANRGEMPERLDEMLEASMKCDLNNVGIFYGLGNHGGGPSRRQLLDIGEWAERHPEVKVVHSGRHRLLDAIRREKVELPVHRGELNFTLRGCYASAARFKFAYRKTENAVAMAERTESVIRGALQQPVKELEQAWDSVLFNSFHDILPGSSIERSYDDQFAWLGAAMHQASCTGLSALNALALKVDTRIAKAEGDHPTANAVLVWNPHPRRFQGYIELEANLDYRELEDYKGRADKVPLRVLDANGSKLPYQIVDTENLMESENWVWRRRVVVPVDLPPMGWSLFEFGYVEGEPLPPAPPQAISGGISNKFYRVKVKPGDAGIQIVHKGKKVLGRDGLTAITVKDEWGSWGGGDAVEAKSLSEVVERWPVMQVETLEQGPERSTLWVRLSGERSRIDLTIHLYRDREAVDVSARVFWNERGVRLKLVMPLRAREAEFAVPGAQVLRKPCGEVPGGRWVRVFNAAGTFGFASDGLYCFDCYKGDFRATVTRATHYAFMSGAEGREKRRVVDSRPVQDLGELKFQFLLHPGDETLPDLAEQLEQPPLAMLVPPSEGKLPRSGSLVELRPATLNLMAIKKATDGKGFVVRVQESTGADITAGMVWQGQVLRLGKVKAHAIATWRLQRQQDRWTATRSNILEG
ncbi:glycoside hydrolase family 38 C-terminal domain-containing protein [Kiritimatiellota bacterium B12222]|nr:glycoside hydrolase family 38 C-terminal domain-containing protein [Kiritimatiellota bacterium B12222]